MALSQDLISKFAKLTVNKTEDTGATFRGTYKKINGQDYVQIEGSDIWTPVDSTVEAEDGEKVKVTIKDHAATIIGNISSPSARNKSVQDLKEEVDEYGNTIQQLDNTIIQQGNSIIQMNNTINQQGNTINQHDNAIHQQGNAITQINNSIKQQDNVIDQINNTITQHGDNIISMNNTIQQHNNNINQMNNVIQQQGNTINQQSNTINQQGNTINQQGNIIEQQGNTITEQNSKITILNSAFSIVDGRLTGLSEAVIDSLETNHLNAKYANIDFSNIQMAAVTKLFTESGIIKDLVVQAGKITGELVGVTIKGDLIEANSLKADKLVVKGSDGLYYKLNIDGLNNIGTSQASKFIFTTAKPDNWETNWKDYYEIINDEYVHLTNNEAPTWITNTYYKLNPDYESGLDGSNIVAQTITADKIAVTDLVAFGATIGGYHIDQHSLYSGVKTSATNTTRGVFLSDDGQFAVGDNSNFLRFFKDQNNQYKLQLSISNKNIEDEIEDIREHSSQTVISSATEPTDTTKIWYNTIDNHFYHYTETSDGTYDWMTIEEDYSDEFEGIRGSITDARQYAKDLADGITDTLDNYMTVSDVDTKIENYDSGIRETFTREINTKTANGDTALELVNDLKACIERGQDTNGKPFVWLKTGSDEGYKLKIQNDSIVIYKGSTPVSTWLSDKFDVSMVITSTLSLGKFDYVVNSDNSLSFKKVRS